MARLLRNDNLVAELQKLAAAFRAKGNHYLGTLKMGRTELQDAVPMTVGQEFNAFGASIESEIDLLRAAEKQLYSVNMGATAVGTGINLGDRLRPVLGEALGLVGMLAFYDKTWNDHWTSSRGYSRLDIDTSGGQLPSDFKFGQYSVVNLLDNQTSVLAAGKFQWGRKNNTDGFISNDYRVQFSFKYNFSYKLGG